MYEISDTDIKSLMFISLLSSGKNNIGSQNIISSFRCAEVSNREPVLHFIDCVFANVCLMQTSNEKQIVKFVLIIVFPGTFFCYCHRMFIA